jgi:hypothetical protein
MYDEVSDKYNHLSINLFLIPLITSIYHHCELYILFSLAFFITGSLYHINLWIDKKLNLKIIILRNVDILVVHSLTPCMIYYSFYDNLFCFIACFGVFSIFLIYYFYSIRVPHIIIHILGSLSIVNAIESCNLNRDICPLC